MLWKYKIKYQSVNWGPTFRSVWHWCKNIHLTRFPPRPKSSGYCAQFTSWLQVLLCFLFSLAHSLCRPCTWSESCLICQIIIKWKCSVTKMFKIVRLQSCGVLTVQSGHRSCCWTTVLSLWTAALLTVQHWQTWASLLHLWSSCLKWWKHFKCICYVPPCFSGFLNCKLHWFSLTI